MKTRLTSTSDAEPSDMPEADALAALRAWYAGLSSREAVARYLSGWTTGRAGDGRTGRPRSARGVLGDIRRALVAAARRAHRDDLAALLTHPAGERTRQANAVAHAIEQLRHARPPIPQIADLVEQWFGARAVRALHAHGIATLADLSVRIPRRR